MKPQLAAGLCFAIILALIAGDNGYNVKYDSGWLPNTNAGTSLKMYIDANKVRFVKNNIELAKIPSSAITEISYGQDVGSVGLTWANGDQKRGLAVHCDKKDYRGILAELEGITGKRAVYSEFMTVKN
jgi:hypothetical protein